MSARHAESALDGPSEFARNAEANRSMEISLGSFAIPKMTITRENGDLPGSVVYRFCLHGVIDVSSVVPREA